MAPPLGAFVVIGVPKIACTDWDEFIASTRGLFVAVTLPCHCIKVQPLEATAVKVTVVPDWYTALMGFAETLPPPGALSASEYPCSRLRTTGSAPSDSRPSWV